MQLELLEKLADENLADLHAGRLTVDGQRRLVTVRRLNRQLVSTPGALEALGLASKAAAAVNHPQILTHLGLFESEGAYFWLSERTEGFDLGTVFGRLSTREVRISPLRTLQIGVDFLEGLVALHEAGLIHGGLGPRCVLIDLDGTARLDGIGFEAVLMDFRELKQKARRGRRDYLAPEVLQGRPPAASADVFSATALLYQLLCGTAPLGDQGQGVSTRHQAVQPPSKLDRSLPYSCDAVFVKALATAPRSRHESVASLRNAIVRLRKALLTGPDEGRAGVAEFISSLYPNEAHVAGMPGTIERPAVADPIVLSGQDITLRASPPGQPGGFGGKDNAITQPGVPLAAGPAGPGAASDPAPVPDPASGGDALGFPETAEPLEPVDGLQAPLHPDRAATAVEQPALHSPEQATAVEAPVLSSPPRARTGGDEVETVRADLVPPFAEDGEDDPHTEEQIFSDEVATAPPPLPDTGDMPRAPVAAPMEAASAPPSAAYRKPAFIAAAALVGLLLISLLLMALGVFSSDAEVGLTGPPGEQRSLIGFLSIESNQKARVVLDGEILPGGTPLRNKLLPAGSHRLVIQAEEGAILMDEVIDLPPGEHKEIRILLGPSPAPSLDGGLQADGGSEPEVKAPTKPIVKKPRKVKRRKRAKRTSKRTRRRRRSR